MTSWWVWTIVGYVSGSLPFALWIGQLRGVDIRTVGSGNVGSTNVGRVCGKKWGVLCFVLDLLKGLLPVLGAGAMLGHLTGSAPASVEAWQWLSVGAAAVIGHVFPVWLKFKGGKGVATGFGVLLGFWPTLTLAGGIAFVVWAVVIKATRYMGLASVCAAVTLPIVVVVLALVRDGHLDAKLPFVVVAALLAVLVVIRHRGNLARLLAGTEPKVGTRSQTPGN